MRISAAFVAFVAVAFLAALCSAQDSSLPVTTFIQNYDTESQYFFPPVTMINMDEEDVTAVVASSEFNQDIASFYEASYASSSSASSLVPALAGVAIVFCALF